ncbi:37561_t:CDS:2, partial [Gigaspora margarita]
RGWNVECESDIDRNGVCEVVNVKDKVVDRGGWNVECECDIDINGVCEVLNVKDRGWNVECESDIDINVGQKLFLSAIPIMLLALLTTKLKF